MRRLRRRRGVDGGAGRSARGKWDGHPPGRDAAVEGRFRQNDRNRGRERLSPACSYFAERQSPAELTPPSSRCHPAPGLINACGVGACGRVPRHPGLRRLPSWLPPLPPPPAPRRDISRSRLLLGTKGRGPGANPVIAPHTSPGSRKELGPRLSPLRQVKAPTSTNPARVPEDELLSLRPRRV